MKFLNILAMLTMVLYIGVEVGFWTLPRTIQGGILATVVMLSSAFILSRMCKE